MRDPDAPYALKSDRERSRRLELLAEPHIAPLTRYTEGLRGTLGHRHRIPNFDPLDGGVRARVLFLLEAPGGKAVSTGFISMNNPDPTARNVHRLLSEAGFTRAKVALWNVVPWYVGADDLTKIQPVSNGDLIQALPHLRALLRLLPRLRVVVLCGEKPRMAEVVLTEWRELSVLRMPHPSQRVFNRWPDKRQEALSVVREAAALTEGRGGGEVDGGRDEP